MITQTVVTVGVRQFLETKSDTYMIQKVGTDEVYVSATDVLGNTFEYIETETPLPEEILTNAEMLEELGIQPNEEEAL